MKFKADLMERKDASHAIGSGGGKTAAPAADPKGAKVSPDGAPKNCCVIS